MLERQRRIRSIYLAQARLLQGAATPEDRALGAAVEAFVHGMPQPDTQRLALARDLREANAQLKARDQLARGPREVDRSTR